MGVKFGREYDDIVDDFAKAIGGIKEHYRFFEMELEDWTSMDEEEQWECLKTMADDIFFSLGSVPKVKVGQGTITYDSARHVLKVAEPDGLVQIVQLV